MCVCVCVFARICVHLCYGLYLLLSGLCALLRMSSCSSSCVVAECVPPFAVSVCIHFSLSLFCARAHARSLLLCIDLNAHVLWRICAPGMHIRILTYAHLLALGAVGTHSSCAQTPKYLNRNVSKHLRTHI